MFSKKHIFSLFVISIVFLSATQNQIPDPDPNRFENEISTFQEWDKKNSFPPDAILFVGSPSIRMWETGIAFPDLPVINRGFGGSHISDVLFFYDTIVKKYKPAMIVFYAGDNDIAGGKLKDQVFKDYQKLISQIFIDNPKAKFVYIPIKPSSSRWNFWPEMKEFNHLVNEFNQKNDNLYYVDLATPMIGDSSKPNDNLFLEDKLHLNEKGYTIWNSILKQFLETNFPSR